MKKLTVLKFPNPLLAKKSQPVHDYDQSLTDLAKAMLHTMYEEGGIGLAAPQVGQHRRLIVVDVRDGEGEEEEDIRNPAFYVNPRIVEQSGEVITEEGCLSVVEFTAEVKRAQAITLEYETTEGETRQEKMTDLKAVCVQHEIDHLDGKLFIDHLPQLKRQMVKKKLAKIARSA